VLLRSTKILASLSARLATQGFAGHLIQFEAGFAPSSSPPAFLQLLSTDLGFSTS